MAEEVTCAVSYSVIYLFVVFNDFTIFILQDIHFPYKNRPHEVTLSVASANNFGEIEQILSVTDTFHHLLNPIS